MASSILRATCVSIFIVFLLAAVNGDDNFDLGDEKKIHLHFFFHDIVNGPNATAVAIIQSPAMNTTAGRFGLVVMVDNALTVGPNLTSKLVGCAQGSYATASQHDLALLKTMNFYFTDGAYNGITLATLARNAAASEIREMSIVGVTGYFRLAQGYAIARTTSLNSIGDATVEYDVYVILRGTASANASSSSSAGFRARKKVRKRRE